MLNGRIKMFLRETSNPKIVFHAVSFQQRQVGEVMDSNIVEIPMTH